MKITFCNTGSCDKLRGLFTKKRVISLLILTAIVTALFVTSTVSVARSHHSKNASNQSQIAQRSLTPTVVLTVIRMLDKTHGWALSSHSILKTSDGGKYWQDVTPKGQMLGVNTQGEFLTAQNAWVAWQSTEGNLWQKQSITILRTSDGGANWQTATINNVIGRLADSPRFINTQQGWLVTIEGESMHHSTINTYQTTDAGQTWINISGSIETTEAVGGISFLNSRIGWIGASTVAGGSHPVIEKTVDGGHSWQEQRLNSIAGEAATGDAQTDAPVMSGANGLLVVHGEMDGNSISIYTTHDSGATWTEGVIDSFNSIDVYTVDIKHIWSEDVKRNIMHLSSNGGKSWSQTIHTPQHFGPLSFIDIKHGWAIDDAGQLYQTTDGGMNWRPIN